MRVAEIGDVRGKDHREHYIAREMTTIKLVEEANDTQGGGRTRRRGGGVE